ncbi:AraC family transcriptional regulator [Duganella sp. FT3S]|uniref:AraC family transcriptional regulator n=1 Tax=Rugamonas fusca TaxID=2758568 RepID=A0A7W2I5B1_9BURK|nr:AraC family transcriptional regulator [Rugamonas fusca]MBA5604202.1 AraC family transcriptional regulator [Rugamonas fusca]
MDNLTSLLTHFSLHAGVFYTGAICGVHRFEQDTMQGHMHLIHRGPVQLIGAREGAFNISEPTLLFLPRPGAHRLVTDERSGADVICGTVRFGSGGRNPVSDALPDVVLITLSDMPGVESILSLMFEEAFSAWCGRQAVLDRLCEVLMIRVLRHCIEHNMAQGGVLAGLADPQLAKAIVAIHDDPARAWTLAAMAAAAGMSRARFALRFKQVTGATPADYLAGWRLMLAQRLLTRGRQLKHVAGDVGYGSASALSRAFVRMLGCSPSRWCDRQRGEIGSFGLNDTARHENETPGGPPPKQAR